MRFLSERRVTRRFSHRFQELAGSRKAVTVCIAGSALLVLNVIAISQAPLSILSPQSPPARIAVVDVQRVLIESKGGKGAHAKLKKLQDAHVAKTEASTEEINQLQKELTEGNLTLSQAKQAELRKQIADKRSAAESEAKAADKEISEARDRELQALEFRLKPVMDSTAKEANLSAVFNKFESGLVYASDSIDITDVIIKRFDDAGPALPAN